MVRSPYVVVQTFRSCLAGNLAYTTAAKFYKLQRNECELNSRRVI